VDTPEGIAAGAWVDDCDWWYRAPVPLDLAPGERAVLELDGVDFYSATWWGCEPLAVHRGMFSRQSLPLPPGRGPLAIRIWGAGALPARVAQPGSGAVRRLARAISPGLEVFPDRTATTKAQFSFGWDFAPRLLTAGIWDAGRIVICRGACIEDAWVRAEPLDPGDPAPVRWRVRLALQGRGSGPLQARISVRPVDGGPEVASGVFPIAPGVHAAELALEGAPCRLWWPWDQGEPYLYDVTVALEEDAGPADELSVTTGVRTIERAALPGGAPWQFVVNGRPVFLRGANWTPADVLPGRLRAADYERLVGMAQAAGLNFLRVWGGGLRETSAFWDACDRMGTLAWQELPLACTFVDHYPRDPDYLGLLAAETGGAARLLRNHPSLLAWCGGNEINRRREAAPLAAIASALAREDPATPWIPSSPSDGEIHNWQVWHGYAPWTDLLQVQAPFVSEFGMQAPPVEETLAEVYPGGAPERLDDPAWEQRKGQPAKLSHYTGGRQAPGAAARELSQRVQAAALQAGIEACRLRRMEASAAGPPCGGVAFWQLNEPWPAVSWSVIDHAGRPKPGYEAVRRSMQPVLAALRFARFVMTAGGPARPYRAGDRLQAEAWLVNDGPGGWEQCRLEAMLDRLPIWAADGLALPPASSRPVGSFEVTLAAPPAALELTLTCGGEPFACNRYDLALPAPLPAPLAARASQWAAALLVRG
jgi:beta-mannosidase